MFASFRRHKWLWGVIFGLTIISFVWFLGPQQGQGIAGSGKEAIGSINGELVTRDEYLNTYREAQLRFRFSYQRWASDDERARQLGIVERETRNRLFLVRKIKDFNIQVAEGAVAEWIAEAFQDPEQHVFRKDLYDRFVGEELPPRGIRQEDFQRFVRHEAAIEHLVSIAGLSGKLVPPQEAEMRYRNENEEVDTQAVFLWNSNYVASVTIDPAAVTTYYTNQQATYRIQERVRVSYVKFDATNYLAEANTAMSQNTNLTAIIDANYLQRGTNSFFGPNFEPLGPEAAKEKIRGEILDQYALVEARKQSIAFANELIELEHTPTVLANFASAKGILSHVTEPFTQFGRPPGLSVPQIFTEAAFKLSPSQPIYEQPIVAADAVFMIGYHERIPSEIPPLENIRFQVTEDYRRSKTTELVNSAGAAIRESIASAVAQGKTFQEACAEQQLTPVDLPPFSQQTQGVAGLPNAGSLPSLKNAAFALSLGEVSAFTPVRDGGFIATLQSKLQPDEAKVKEALPNYLANLRRSQQYEAFSTWLQKELEAAQISLPGGQESEAVTTN